MWPSHGRGLAEALCSAPNHEWKSNPRLVGRELYVVPLCHQVHEIHTFKPSYRQVRPDSPALEAAVWTQHAFQVHEIARENQLRDINQFDRFTEKYRKKIMKRLAVHACLAVCKAISLCLSVCLSEDLRSYVIHCARG